MLPASFETYNLHALGIVDYFHQQTDKGVSGSNTRTWLPAGELIREVTLAHSGGYPFVATVGQQEMIIKPEERFSSFFPGYHNQDEGFLYLHYWMIKDARLKFPV